MGEEANNTPGSGPDMDTYARMLIVSDPMEPLPLSYNLLEFVCKMGIEAFNLIKSFCGCFTGPDASRGSFYKKRPVKHLAARGKN
jgi:hypothetical protein